MFLQFGHFVLGFFATVKPTAGLLARRPVNSDFLRLPAIALFPAPGANKCAGFIVADYRAERNDGDFAARGFVEFAGGHLTPFSLAHLASFSRSLAAFSCVTRSAMRPDGMRFIRVAFAVSGPLGELAKPLLSTSS